MKQNKILVTAIIVVDLILAVVCMTVYFGEDRVEPEFRFQADENIYNYADSKEKLLDNIVAVDDRDGDISDRIVIEKITENRDSATIIVYYAVSDSAGNVAKISRVFPTEFEEQESTGQEDMETYQEAPGEESLAVEILSETEDGKTQENGGNDGGEDRNEGEEAGDENQKAGNEDGEGEEKRAGADDVGRDVRENNDDMNREERNLARDERRSEEAENAVREETQNQDDAGQRETEPRQESGSGSPILTLAKEEVTVDAGNSPPWTEIIEVLRDDKDNYETLYYNLSVSRFNRNQPGDYPVSLYTEDSDGNRSETVSIMVHVK